MVPPFDRAFHALMTDLDRSGKLNETLVVVAAEFGRSPKITRSNRGREHWPDCYSVLFAGAGIKPGIVYGETDDYSYNILEKPVHINDINATILHCMGIDHERFAFSSQGLDQRLTGVEPQRVVREVLDS